jgi:hypothetical protein
MILEALTLLSATAMSAAPPFDTAAYAPLVAQAATDCKNVRGREVDAEMVDLLWRLAVVENQYNPAPEVRGMILAAACMESGYNSKAKGDRKFSKSGKKPMAIGILQMWPIYEKMFPGLDRTDPIAAAHAWMTHISNMIPRVKKRCRYKKPEKIWVAAWVTGIRYKKKGGRCREKPNHLRLLKRWQRNIERIKATCSPLPESTDDNVDTVDGC